MTYKFGEWDHEPDTQASSSRAGWPPRKTTAIGLLDPEVPSRRQGPLFPISAMVLMRICATVILVGMLVGIFLLFLPRH